MGRDPAQTPTTNRTHPGKTLQGALHVLSSLVCRDGYFPAVGRIAEVMLRVVSQGSNVILVITQNTHSRLALFIVVTCVLTEATGRVVEHSADCLAHGAHRRGSG
jgi:hypothetical protein